MQTTNISRFHLIVLYLLVIIGSVFIISSFTAPQQVSKSENFPQNYQILTPPVPKEMKMFDEEIPLKDIDIYERLEREIIVNTYWHSSTILMMKRAARWFPVIEPILKKNNIPDDFKYIAVIESGLDNVVSPAGAVGFWQFIKATAPRYGLDISYNVDERYNVEKSTQAACDYIREAYNKFGRWADAAASFNMGIDGVARQVERQKTTNYYNMTLSSETERYIFRAVAMKLILSNPERYGFKADGERMYEPYKTYEVEITSDIKDLAQWSIDKGINYKWLKILNPWLRDKEVSVPAGTTYKIKLPEPGSVYIIPEN